MKKLTSGWLVLCIAALMITSCGGSNPTKLLAKTWTVSNIETSVEIPDSVKSSMLANSEMAFTDDGHYTSSGGVGADQGTYTLDKDGKTLSTTSQAGKQDAVYSIENLSDDKLVLKNDGNTVTCTAKK